jgi:hypothetical protein
MPLLAANRPLQRSLMQASSWCLHGDIEQMQEMLSGGAPFAALASLWWAFGRR